MRVRPCAALSTALILLSSGMAARTARTAQTALTAQTARTAQTALAAPAAPAAPVAPIGLAAFAGDTLPLKATKGTELSKEEEEQVRSVLRTYLEALKRGDYAEAGKQIDRASFLASVDTLARMIASDDTQVPAARRKLFGASTPDSLAARPVSESFRSYMEFQEATNPEMRDILQKAELQILAARRMNDRVHVAYQLTLPAEKPDAQPFTSVTAEQVREVDGQWKIVFRLDH